MSCGVGRRHTQIWRGVAVAVASNCSFSVTPSLGTSMCCWFSYLKKKKKSQRVGTVFSGKKFVSLDVVSFWGETNAVLSELVSLGTQQWGSP